MFSSVKDTDFFISFLLVFLSIQILLFAWVLNSFIIPIFFIKLISMECNEKKRSSKRRKLGGTQDDGKHMECSIHWKHLAIRLINISLSGDCSASMHLMFYGLCHCCNTRAKWIIWLRVELCFAIHCFVCKYTKRANDQKSLSLASLPQAWPTLNLRRTSIAWNEISSTWLWAVPGAIIQSRFSLQHQIHGHR